jgi:hypothetical protein
MQRSCLLETLVIHTLLDFTVIYGGRIGQAAGFQQEDRSSQPKALN